MNSFMNAIYNAVGSQVSGFYKNEPFVGTITTTRPMYGTDIQVGVTVPGDLYLIEGTTLYEGGNGVFTNLVVNFN
tara:strand:- start:182 stop:406 length:225 start_codon:yes stop_codon:yes gene_type:complete